jgi:2-keto-myo-inositol isomerase
MRADQIAINSVSTKHDSLDEALPAYAAAGFKQVEFVIPQIKQWFSAQPGRTVKEFKALLDKQGLRSIGGFETIIQSFGDEDSRKQNHELHVRNAELIDALGGGTIVVGTDGDNKNNLETLRTIGRTMRSVVAQFPRSVKLAVEFNWSPVVKSVRSAHVVVEEAADPRVGILFDPAHFHCTSSKFEDLTPDVIKHIAHVHVDDMRNLPGEHSNCNADRMLPGEGILDLKRLLGTIEQGGYRGAFSIEMFNEDLWKLPVDEAARRCYAAMMKLCA